MSRIKLYDLELSGHCHRIRLFLSLLGLEYERVTVDLAVGEHKNDSFLKKNPFGKIPVLEDGKDTVFDSNAILVYLAKKYGKGDWLPEDPVFMAQVQAWLSVAAGEIAHGPARARLITVFGAKFDEKDLLESSKNLFSVMDKYLSNRSFLVNDECTIADISCYSYIAHSPEGNVDLSSYRNVTAWLRRVEAIPGFIPMQSTKVGLNR